MKSLVCWLLGPIVRWASGPVATCYSSDDESIVSVIAWDCWRLVYEAEKTPDDLREKAWKMIGMADDFDRVQEMADDRAAQDS